jgi:cobalt-zinc-cadmium efflux system protein
VQAFLESLPGVDRVHDLHVWAMGTSEIAMTAHLVMPQGHADDAFLKHATDQLHDRFEIEHATIQVVRVPFTRPCASPPLPGPADKSGQAAAQVHEHVH